MKTAGVLMCMALSPLFARADGGAVCLHEASGQFLVTVFVSPSPLRAGPVDISVLVQDQQTGAIVLDPAIELELQSLSGKSAHLLNQATREHAANKLLQAVRLDLPDPGWWGLRVVVSRGRQEAVFVAKLQVAPAALRVDAIWPFLLFPVLAVGLFAIHQALRRSKPR